MIDWDYDNPTISASGASFKWKNTTTSISYKAIYDDGRYARYVFPLKEDFTNYEKLLIVPPDYSGGTTDWESYIFDTATFDFMLSFPKNSLCDTYSITTPGWNHSYEFLWLPYNGGKGYNYSNASKSTKSRLVTYFSADFCKIILEIYGMNRVYS